MSEQTNGSHAGRPDAPTPVETTATTPAVETTGTLPAVETRTTETETTRTTVATEGDADGATPVAPRRTSPLMRLGAVALGGLLAAAVGLSGNYLPSQQVNAQGVSVAASGVYVCPVAGQSGPETTVALTARGDGVTAQSLSGGSSRRAVPSQDRTVLEKLGDAVRMDVDGGSRAGGLALSAENGAGGRGLGAVACATPRTDSWLTGLVSSEKQLGEIILTNVDPAEADVDLTFFDQSGIRVAQGSRSIVVRPGTTVRVALEPLLKTSAAPSDAPLTARVRTSQGRVQATARQRVLDSAKVATAASDWVQPVAEPQTTLIVPGVPATAGARDLVITNPGKERGTAKVEVLRANGVTTVVEGENIPLKPESTTSVSLETALRGDAVALRVTSTVPATAALRGRSAKDGDLFVIPATPAFGAHALVPLPTSTTAKLSLANPTGNAASVHLSIKGRGEQTVEIPANSIKLVDLPDGASLVELEGSRDVVGALMLSRDLGGLPGAAVVPLLSADAPRTNVTPQEDPGVGR